MFQHTHNALNCTIIVIFCEKASQIWNNFCIFAHGFEVLSLLFSDYKDTHFLWVIQTSEPFLFQNYVKSRLWIFTCETLASNKIINIEGYDCYVDDANEFGVSEYLNKTDSVLIPNLTYYPRACFMPSDSICDGSVAILTKKIPEVEITDDDLAYYATDEFSAFYKIARNMGTRSLNIDNNSVFFFGKKK